MSALALIYERVRTKIAPYGPLEHVLINADSETSYVGIAKAGSATSAAAWIIVRLRQSGNTVFYRFARSSALINDQENMDKILDNYATYNYVD